ncbi:MAG: DUF2520 domain-containing protein [Desulfobacterales bacterium]|nr:DUF2520 domain-containing protein [Desulfobacterales bacterium]
MKKPSVAIVGCGKVGTALGKFLTAAGYRLVGISCKNFLSAQRAADLLHPRLFSDVAWEVTATADVVFVSTPDDVIEEVCGSISRHNGFKQGAVVLHCSGALPSTILASARQGGMSTGSMHPLQSFASLDFSANPFHGIAVFIEGDQTATVQAGRMASDLGANCLTIETSAKILYHAAAVVASNYLVALLDLAFKLIGKAKISGRDAYRALTPLIEGTLANISNVGIPQALTGPIARGDVEIVKRHVTEIAAKAPELLELYKTLGCYTVDVARAKGGVSESCVKELKDVLG